MGISWLLKPVALVSTVALSTLGLLSKRYQRARFYFNVTIYVSTLGLMSVWGVVVSILATAAGQRLNINYYVARSFYGLGSPLLGIKFEVEGEEHLEGLMTARDGQHQGAVLLSNHQSFLDILYIGRIFPKRAAIMAKKELKWTPLLGQFMSLSGAVFVNRKNRHDAVKALAIAGEDMKKKGISLWIFPEGTRSSSPEPTLLPFKKGAFHLAVQAQIPIVPIVCENYHRLFDGRTRFESGVLKIRVLPPIPTTGLTVDDVTTIVESTRESMLHALREISEPGPSSSLSTSSATPLAPPIPEHITQPLAGAPIQLDISDSIALRQRGANSSGISSGICSEWSESERKFEEKSEETTEDEMDEDAVLLKKPKGSVA
ncbi:lysophosphatidate acyltransferase [Cryptococcus gattii E566]|uniref:1-acyl-sn-glycerol-3-phosphate acyltransferase n=2 Tax=Cryptococcus gattii TaxID=37769 RepID=E6RCP7_CRYGW|nr:1-acylglycerol-3-phosphate O-acyltransferase, putative [Cryptococcus gattii WM276]ADV24659.1 1-acylglycerol-3-phosphate O-acyltransferase, putative [Cryptococcus gattii WM276]KIR80264.1 lysophosphatidate acyltransferase [Cryptococcus gattii EJB2]KIY31458.1 lysophosphatidate acyltransferase [Cryptococcus gattii E566]KJE00396.1 lysophosphatidate acyltransferase [Cryptococcus gattii NT-10]